MRLRTWILVIVVTAALITGMVWLTSKPLPEVTVYDGPLQFDGDQSMQYLSALVTGYPQRDYTNPQRLEAAQWIEREMKAAGLQVFTQDFDEVIYGKNVTGLRNVYAVIPGKSDKAILVAGHYDIPPYVTQGAGDDASGTVTAMELARVFAKEPTPRYTMIFMASDSEEYGAMWGSFNFLEKSGWKDKLAAVLTLDFANMGELAGVKVRSMGIQQGYTPLWLREAAYRSAGAEAKPIDVSTFNEWVERSVIVAPTEHGVYLRAGIPAVNLGTTPKDPAWQSKLYHTPGDTLDKIQPATMATYGRAAERLLRTIQAMPALPKGEMFYLKTGSKYIPGWALRIIQLLALLPLGAAVAAAWRRAGAINDRQIWAEARQLLALFGAGVLGYIALWLSSENGLMTKFEMYPATQKDPILNRPEILPLLLVLAAAVGGYFFLRWLLRVEPVRDTDTRQAVVLTGMLGLITLAIAFNAGFAALALLAPAIILWPLVKPGQGTGRRVANILLSLTILAVFVVFITLFKKLYFIGYIWWYLLMCAAYGLFRARAILTFLASLALAVRFISAAGSPPSSGSRYTGM